MDLFELAHIVSKYEGALRASLQAVYQLRLLPGAGGRTEPSRTPRELADLVAHLPHGCALWIEIGGALAITDESHLLRELIFQQEIANYRQVEQKGPKPERIPLPRPAAELRAEQREQHDRMAEKARRHAARDRRRSPTT